MSSLEKLDPFGGLASDVPATPGAARRDHVVTSPSFGETYPKQEFSELDRLGLALGGWIARRRRLFTVKPDLRPPAKARDEQV
jgi:hypothetical protein